MNRNTPPSLPVHPDFKRLFFLKEGKALAGANWQNIWILVGILFVTFIAIGFANGSLKYLQHKMDDPFINWVSVEVPSSLSEEMDKVKEVLNQSQNKELFEYGSVTTNSRFLLRIVSPRDQNTYIAKGRTIEPHNPILDQIILAPNLHYGRGFNEDNDVGLLVTVEFLKRLGYPVDAGFITMAYSAFENEADALLPIPVVGIVQQLPGKHDFASTPYFYSQRKVGRSSSTGNPFNPRNTQDLLLFIEGDENKAFALKDLLEEKSKEGAFAETFQALSPFAIIPYPEEQSFKQGYVLGFGLLFEDAGGQVMSQQQAQMYEALLQFPEVAAYAPIRVYRYSFDNKTAANLKTDRISVHFTSLDRIRDFQKHIISPEFAAEVSPSNQELGLEIDLAQIEAKENYNFVSRLTRIISLILIGFSVLSICLFVSHMFQKHLDKVSRNIGTFKAFGIGNRDLISIYLGLISAFMLGATIVSLILAAIVGSLGGVKLLLHLISDRLEPGETYFELFNLWTGIAVVILLGISLLVLYRTARTILSRTPGDLIYKRF